jgi:hypothetical protein
MLEKHVFSQPKRRKLPLISGRWNSKFWGYLWRTCDDSHPEPHKIRLLNKNCTIFPLILSESDADKRVQDVRIDKFEVIYEEQMNVYIQIHTKYEFETKICTHFPLILSESDADKTRSGRWNSKFKVIYEEQVMAHIQNHTKHDFET